MLFLSTVQTGLINMSVTSLVYPFSSLELVVFCSRGRSRVPIEGVSIQFESIASFGRSDDVMIPLFC